MGIEEENLQDKVDATANKVVVSEYDDEAAVDNELREMMGISEDESEDDSKAPDVPEKAPEKEGEPPTEKPEEKPLEDRLKAFEEKHGLKIGESPEVPEAKSPDNKEQLTQYEAALKAEEQSLQNFNLLQDLPQFDKDGKLIYELSSKELNDYLIELRDSGQEFKAAQVQTAYFNAVDKAKQLKSRLEQFTTAKQNVENFRHVVEWQQIRTEVSNLFPEVTQEDFDKIGAHIDAKSGADSAFAQSVTTPEGKLQAGIKAMDSLGILKRLRESVAPKEDKKQPAAPDASAGSKRVKSLLPGNSAIEYEAVRNLPQEKFNKLSDDQVDKLLEAELGTMLRL